MMTATELLQCLWSTTLALSFALVAIAALRMPWRHWFGAEHACRLWWLVPVALVASQWPHTVHDVPVVHVAGTARITGAVLQALEVPTVGVDWHGIVVLTWLAGALVLLLLDAWKQCRFQRVLRGAQPATLAHATKLPVLRVDDTSFGPALVGMWRPRIVVPADFTSRYGVEEQALILAHEITHARRQDTRASFLAVVLRALFWFHPGAWWAERCLRRDQDMACDAEVIRRHRGARRRYANVLLEAQQVSRPAPLACPWATHPLKERIAMLKREPASSVRRVSGGAAAIAIVLACAGLVHAGSQSVTNRDVDHYTLEIRASGPPRPNALHLVRCVVIGESVHLEGSDGVSAWDGDVRVQPVPQGVQIGLILSRDGQMIAAPTIVARPGEEAMVTVGDREPVSSTMWSAGTTDPALSIRMRAMPGCTTAMG